MKEATFNAELIKSLRHWGAWAYKIQDLPASMTMGLRYTPDKPCDIIGTYRGHFFAIESKQIKKFEAFGMRHMRPAQIEHLNAITATGSRAFVFLNIRIPPSVKKKVKGKVVTVKQKRENRTIIFEWRHFVGLGDRTLKKDEVEKLSYLSYQRVKKHPTDKTGDLIYDLKAFLVGL